MLLLQEASNVWDLEQCPDDFPFAYNEVGVGLCWTKVPKKVDHMIQKVFKNVNLLKRSNQSIWARFACGDLGQL